MNELPMNPARLAGKKIIFSGGGYFRLLPYKVIDTLMSRAGYSMTYFHPRDFDADQPVLPGMTMKRKFMSYVGLKKSFLKFNRLLNDHKFVSVGNAGIEWEKTPVVALDEL
jgi:hypothetical protein